MKQFLITACALAFLLQQIAVCAADDWPQFRGPSRDGVWRETGLIDKFDGPTLTPRWRVQIGSGYSGPSVADGRVYVTDRVVEPKQVERVHCFDAKTGKPIWKHVYDCSYRGVQYDAGPRANVTLDDGRAYALGTMGHFFCLDAAKGRVLWKKDLGTEYKIRMPVWGVSAAPLIEGDRVIVQIGGEGACLVAFDKTTGKECWKALDDQASYSAPIVVDQAGRRVLICYTGDRVVGLDPKTGKLLWEQPFPARQVVIGIASPVPSGDLLYLTNFFDGSLMLRLGKTKPTIAKVWQRVGQDERHTEALHSIISTPFIDGGFIYGVDSYGELRCLKAADGDRVWESDKAVPHARWANIHFTRNGPNTWLFNERGDLILARLTPKGYEEISRAHLIDPTERQLPQRGGVCWAPPAFADRCVFVRNDEELVCASLAKKAK